MRTSPDQVYSREELSEMLRKMHEASSDFYAKATRIGNHAFIEFTGFMNEYIKICERNLGMGVDFTQANTHSGDALDVHDYEMRYIAEKFDCIFGPVFEKPEMRQAFMQRMGWLGEPHHGEEKTQERETVCEVSLEGINRSSSNSGRLLC